MSINGVSVVHKASANKPVNEIVEKYLYQILTPDLTRQIKFELGQAGYNVESISLSSTNICLVIK